MSLPDFLNEVGDEAAGNLFNPTARRADPKRSRQVNLEALESRLLLSASVTSKAHNLLASSGDPGNGDVTVPLAVLVVAPLTGSSGNVITGQEGSSTGTVLLGTFTDANQAATAADFTTPPGSVVVDWGDGSAPQTLAAGNLTSIGTPNSVEWTINAAHTYTEEGTYAYTVTVTDTDGAATIVSGSAVITDAALTAGPATNLTLNTGIALPGTTVVGTFTDANIFATTSDFTDTVDWGDGAPQSTGVIVATATPGVFDVEAGHTYAKPGVDTTRVTVHDDGGSQVVIEGSATVTDLPVTGSTKNFTTVEGQNTGQFVLATFEDPNTLATLSDVNAKLAVGGWGDGTPSVAGVQLVVQQTGVDPSNGDPTFEVLGSHTYTEATPTGAPDPLSVIVTTLGGATTTLTSPPGGGVTVVDAPLTAGPKVNLKARAVVALPGTTIVGTFTDANTFATTTDFTCLINWGDGSPQSAGTIVATATPGVFDVEAGHKYLKPGVYKILVTVQDVGGSHVVIAGSATVTRLLGLI